MLVTLSRIGRINSGPQFGILRVNDQFCAVTLERPWLSNVQGVSSIPLGTYSCLQVLSRTTEGGLYIPITFEVQSVPERSGILFHIGNYLKNTKGCILLGMGFSYKDTPMITESKIGFERFLNATKELRRFDLNVTEI